MAGPHLYDTPGLGVLQNGTECYSMDMDEKLLSAKEVKAYLKISRQTLYRLEKSGAVNPVKIGTVKRYRESDIAGNKKIK